MLVTITTQNKKCIVETEDWVCDKEPCKDDLIELGFTEDEYEELPDSLTMKATVDYRWGEVTVDISKEEFEETDWENNDEWWVHDREDWSFSDGCGSDQDYDFEISDNVDMGGLYDIFNNNGDVDECEVVLLGPLTATVDEDQDAN